MSVVSGWRVEVKNTYINTEGRTESLCADYDTCNEANGDSCGHFVVDTSAGFTGQYLNARRAICLAQYELVWS